MPRMMTAITLAPNNAPRLYNGTARAISDVETGRKLDTFRDKY